MSQELVLQQKAGTLKKLLEVSKKEIEAALPRHLTPERMLRIAMTEARKNPVLLDCTQASFIGAIIQAAQLGLEPGGALGHCYLVPFNNRKKGIQEVQFMVGYRGMMDLAGRSERVSHVIARAVYAGDQFEYEFGLDEKLIHKPGDVSKRGNLTHVYSIAFLKTGGRLFDVMTIREVNDIRERSRSKDSGPWVSDFEAMAKKSVVRRLFKFMPVSIEIQQAVGLDELNEADQPQDLGAVIEAEGKTMPSESDALQAKIDAKKTEAAPKIIPNAQVSDEAKALFGTREPGSDG